MAKENPSAEVQQLALDRVLEEREFILSLTTAMRANWLRWYEITRHFRVSGMSTYNKVFVPLGWMAVEQIAPRITAHDPTYELIPTKNSSIPFTDIVSEWLMFMWEEKDLRRQARLMVKGGLIYGAYFVKLEMDQVVRKEVVEREVVGEQEVFNPETGEVEVQEVEEIVEEEIELSNLPVFRTVDIFDIDIDPRVEQIEDARALIHNTDSVSFSDLKRDEEVLGYFNLDKIKALASSSVSPEVDDKSQKLDIRGITSTKGSSDGVSDSGGSGVDLNALTVREYWGRFSPENDAAKEEEYVITIVNDAVVIRLEKNPYITEEDLDGIRPFEIFVDHDVPNELYGVGEIEPTETLQIGVNKIRNQRLDNVDFTMNRMWIYDRLAGVDPRDLVSFPGNFIAADDVNGVQPVPTPDVTSSGYAEEDRYLRDFQLANGTINSTGGGGRDDFTNTATGIKQRSKEQQSRLQLKIENLESTLARIGKKMLQMINAQEEEVFVIRRRDKAGGVKFTEIERKALTEAITGMNAKVKSGSTFSDDSEDRRNDAIAEWNIDTAAFNAGAITKEELAKTYRNMKREAFKRSGLVSEPAQQPLAQEQLNPAQTQLNPDTLVPNGVQPGLPIQPVTPPQL